MAIGNNVFANYIFALCIKGFIKHFYAFYIFHINLTYCPKVMFEFWVFGLRGFEKVFYGLKLFDVFFSFLGVLINLFGVTIIFFDDLYSLCNFFSLSNFFILCNFFILSNFFSLSNLDWARFLIFGIFDYFIWSVRSIFGRRRHFSGFGYFFFEKQP